MLYKGCIGDKKAARPPEGSPTEVGGLSASNLPLVSIPHPTRMLDGPAKRPGKYAHIRNNDLRVEVRLYGHYDVPQFEGGQVHSLYSDKLLTQWVGILVYIYTGLLQSCFKCYEFAIELPPFYFLSASGMLAEAAEPVSVVILVYSAR